MNTTGSNDYERLAELLSDGKEQELKQWLQDEKNREVYLDFLAMREAFYSRHAAAPDVENEWKEVSRRLQLTPRRPLLHRRWMQGVVAAAAVVLLLVLFHFYPLQKSEVSVSAVTISPLPQSEVTLSTGTDVLALSDIRSDSLIQVHSYVATAEGIAYQNDHEEEAVEEYTLTVPVGKTFRITLSDGTLVCLNADSRLRFPSRFSDTREVTLEGEAYFEVSRQEDAPFIVHCGESRVEVLGTHFCVTNYPERNPRTTLVEGKVRVTAGSESVVLHPDMQAEVTGESIRVREVDSADYLAWMTGIYRFTNRSFGEVMTQVGRMYGAEVEFVDEALKKKRVTGVIDVNDDLLFSLSLFNRVLNVSVEAGDSIIYIKKTY